MEDKIIPRINLIIEEEKLKGNNITTAYLAEKLNLKDDTIRKYRQGTAYPTTPGLFKLAKLLNRKTHDLYEEKNSEDRI